MMKFTPGGPFDSEKVMSDAVRKVLEERYHLDKPLWKQYQIYLTGLAKLDLGPSYNIAHLRVNDVLAEGIHHTLTIGALAMIFAIVMGIFIGAIAGLFQNSWVDHMVMSSAMFGISVPSMVLAPLLLIVLAIKIRIFPVGGLNTTASYVLPSFCLSLFYLANIARLTRGSILEILKSNFITTARSKGLPTWRILFFHCLRPTLIPVVSYLGPATAGMLAGSLVIEKIFNIPGIGRQFVDSAFSRDYTMALGMILFYCALVVFFNALVDIAYLFLDPKVRARK